MPGRTTPIDPAMLDQLELRRTAHDPNKTTSGNGTSATFASQSRCGDKIERGLLTRLRYPLLRTIVDSPGVLNRRLDVARDGVELPGSRCRRRARPSRRGHVASDRGWRGADGVIRRGGRWLIGSQRNKPVARRSSFCAACSSTLSAWPHDRPDHRQRTGRWRSLHGYCAGHSECQPGTPPRRRLPGSR